MDKTRVGIVVDKAGGTLPHWWEQLASHHVKICSFTVVDGSLANYHIVILSRAQMMNLSNDHLSTSKIFIVMDEAWSAQNLKRILQKVPGALIVDSQSRSFSISSIFELALSRYQEQEARQRLLQTMRSQNQQIEVLNRSLEKVVQERTQNEAQSRRASQMNVTRVRAIIGFIKELTQIVDIQELLPSLRRQLKEFHSVESPILFIPKSTGYGDLYYLQGSQTVHSRVQGEWEVSPRIRINEPADSRVLADMLGRPVGKLFRFPLVTVRHQRDLAKSPLLLFEHGLPANQVDQLVESLAEKLQPVSWVVDRLVLEQDLKSASRDWEQTFDELSEPIAILDREGRTLRGNSHWRDEYSSLWASDQSQFRREHKLFAVERYPIRLAAEDEPLSWVIYLRDETRSQRLKGKVVQMEKMSAIGQLAGHIAHELNNPLTGIRSLTQVLLQDKALSTQIQADLDEVERASGRCQAIINNLLDYSKSGIDHKVQIMDLNDITKKTLPFLKSATGRFRSEIQFSDEQLLVRVEPHLMQQVIFNLVNNACQAMRDKGEITVHTKRQAKWALLEISDTGPGVDPHLGERIFEPFFTTKKDGEGTGLGLSLARDFVRQFGGDVEFESQIGHGATFRVRLPLEVES